MISSPRSGAADLRLVTVVDTAFMPAVVEAYVGDFVRWHFEDAIVHRVSAVGVGFDSGDMSAGQSFAVGFGASGAYRFYCRYHGTPEGTGMAGVVNVDDPDPASTTLPPSWETTTSRPPTPPTWPTTSTTAPSPVPTMPPGPYGPPGFPPPPVAPPPGRPGPSADDANGVSIASSWEWAPPGRPRYVAGQVVNDGSRPVRAVNIVVDMLTADGRLMATTWAFTGASFLPPGGRAGFEFEFTPPPGYDNLAVRISSQPVTVEAPHSFSVNITNRYTDRYGDEHLVGQVRNDGIAAGDVWVLGTFFDGDGHPAGFERQLVVGGLAPGQTGSFEFLRPAHRPPYAGVHLAADTVDALVALPLPAPVPGGGRYGYWMVGASGKVYGFGDAADFGDADGRLGPAGAVDLEPTPSGGGYWIADDTGRVFPFGDAAGLGQAGPSTLTPGEKATSLAATPTGAGYWMFTSRGRVLVFGDAPFLGDMSGVVLAGPVLDSVITPSGRGYYMVASDGGIFAFGDAAFHGSMGGQRLNAPVQSLVPDADGAGYWLVASDGGIFAFGAPFRGSLGQLRLNQPVAGMVRAGSGYLMVGEDGGIFDFSGEAGRFKGSLGDNPPARPIRAVAVFEGR